MAHEGMFKHKHVPLHSDSLEDDDSHTDKTEERHARQRGHHEAAIAGKADDHNHAHGTKGRGNDGTPRSRKRYGRLAHAQARSGEPMFSQGGE